MGKSPHWPEIVETNPNLTFRLTEHTIPVCEREAVFQAIQKATNQETKGSRGTCMVTGEETTIQRLHPAIKGVRGAQTMGANIVSFNLRAFESYGKEQKQGENAPVGKYAAFAYTTALNHLLGKDSRQKMPVGDATAVFWSRSVSHLEDSLPALLGEPPKDDPDANTREVEALFRSIEQGSPNIADNENTFFVLGLSPNASRISIRFWLTGTVREFSTRIAEHFQSIEICRSPRDPRYLSLFRLLVATAQQGKADNIPPNLAGDTLRAILSGLPYPETLLAAVLRRIRAEHEVNYPRAALVKACLNRASRSPGSAEEEELKVSLDISNTNIGYRLGRLFAALEKIQEEANPGLNATIRDRFYGAASSTPITVFATLMKLSKHHLAKIENRGRAVNLEKLLQEINDGLDGDAGFPAHLSLADQGRFAIGYYHQKQSFYTKKSEGDQQ
jgi:CRISPR-associated protein Csd1